MTEARVDDECLKALVEERLRDDPQFDAITVTVTVREGRITLTGTVESSRIERLIEEVGEQFGDVAIDNRLRST